MKNYAAFAAGLLLSVGLLASCSVQAAPIHYLDNQGVNPTPVTPATPLPVTMSGGGSNAAAGTTGSAVPSSASANGVNVGGTLRGQTGTNTSGSIYAADTNIVNQADGADATQGAKADSACATDNGTCTISALVKRTNQNLTTLNTTASGAIPAGTNVIGYNTPDPCSQISKSGGVINLTASGQIITGTAAKKTYICSINFVSATAQNIALVEGTGSTCATNIFGLAGGTTAATGWNLSANGGMTLGNGLGTVVSPSADSNATAANVCLLLSGSGQTSGQIAYVQQ